MQAEATIGDFERYGRKHGTRVARAIAPEVTRLRPAAAEEANRVAEQARAMIWGYVSALYAAGASELETQFFIAGAVGVLRRRLPRLAPHMS